MGPGPPPTFGRPRPGVAYQKRPAAYAVIRGPRGLVAGIRASSGSWLPGGGIEPGETPEQAVVREVREELGRAVQLLGRIGQAVQYFHAPDEDIHYAMEAIFFRAEFVGGSVGPAEYALCWLDARRPDPPFFHACHAWAVEACREP